MAKVRKPHKYVAAVFKQANASPGTRLEKQVACKKEISIAWADVVETSTNILESVCSVKWFFSNKEHIRRSAYFDRQQLDRCTLVPNFTTTKCCRCTCSIIETNSSSKWWRPKFFLAIKNLRDHERIDFWKNIECQLKMSWEHSYFIYRDNLMWLMQQGLSILNLIPEATSKD